MTGEPPRWFAFALVAGGGAVGAALRYAAFLLLASDRFPWATLAVNLAGCALIGLLLPLIATRPAAWLLLSVGLLGGLTTFSSFALDAVALMRAGHTSAAVAYLLASAGGGMVACAAGWWVGVRLAA